jgi:hypothetical protein
VDKQLRKRNDDRPGARQSSGKRVAREIVITSSRVPSEQLRAIADHIGDPSPPRAAVTASAVDEYLLLASTAGHEIVWTADGRLIEIVR